MDIHLHNSAARGKERFVPLDPDHVRVYVCGPTVYDLAHLGNARPVVVFDVLARLLRSVYPRVTYARNITDVEDKIIERAASSGEASTSSPRAPRPTTTATWPRSATCRRTWSRGPPARSRR
jgi:cysteinyl-tRNA synthetase